LLIEQIILDPLQSDAYLSTGYLSFSEKRVQKNKLPKHHFLKKTENSSEALNAPYSVLVLGLHQKYVQAPFQVPVGIRPDPFNKIKKALSLHRCKGEIQGFCI
jgi:hypothetical protein